MRRRTHAPRSKVDLARIGFRIGDELGDIVGRDRQIYLHDVGQAHCSADWSAVADEIERKPLVERRIDGVVRSDESDGVAIGDRAQRRLHSDIAARNDPVLNNELLPQVIRQKLADNARDDVVGAAGRKTYDPAHWPRRIDLGAREARDGWDRSGTRREMQKSATRK